MKLFTVFRKTFRERMRDFWLALLSMIMAPFFILIYYLMMGGSSFSSYDIILLSHDRGVTLEDGSTFNATDEVREVLSNIIWADSTKPVLSLREGYDRERAEQALRDRQREALLILDEDFSQSIYDRSMGDSLSRPKITLIGDLSNPYYTPAAVMAIGALDSYFMRATNTNPPYDFEEIALGGSASRTEFEFYVPGIFVAAVIFLLYEVCMLIAREVSAGTMDRLNLTRMKTWEYLGGITLTFIVFGLVQVVFALGTAIGLGFTSEGPIWITFLVGGLLILPVIAFGLITASFSRSESEAFVYSNFPLFLLIFFSGSMFPFSQPSWFHLFGRSFGPMDLLPPTHGVNALNKVMTHGCGIGDIWVELVIMMVLTVVYFAIGAYLFQWRQTKAR